MNHRSRISSIIFGNLLLVWALLSVAPSLFAARPAHGEKGMIAAASKPASLAGLEMLQQGGNAIDAAVAVGFALAVTHPRAGNLGGGGFMVIHLADGSVKTLDFREKAPGKAHRDMYLDKDGNVIPDLSIIGHLAAGVPGSVDGLLKLLETHGTLTRAQVLAPALRLAREGFPLSWQMCDEFAEHMPHFKKFPASLAKFTNNGQPYRPGDVWKQPDLAKTIQRIIDHGRDGFYAGETAKLIVAEMERGGGLISSEDLAGYQSVWREPMHGAYRGMHIWSMPPPSSGGVLLVHLLHILEQYDVKAMGWHSADLIHLMVEAQRRAYADRAEHLGDPDFVKMPLEMLLSEDYAKKRMENFDPVHAGISKQVRHGAWPKESPETTHYSVVDHLGNAVSCTTTINGHYGNYVTVAGAGFVLNNEMDDFSTKPDTPNMYGLLGREANEIRPHKRMLSSMTPTIVSRDGKPFLIVGSPGGSTIITTVLQVVMNVVDFEMNIADAVSAPRFHHQWMPDAIFFEPTAIGKDAMDLLKLRGHQDFRVRDEIGAANGIVWDKDGFHGGADPRRWNCYAIGH